MTRPRLVGINHVAVEVEDVDRALEFWGQLFDVDLRGRMEGAAFVDLGDQFVALMAPSSGEVAHFGLVVDDKQAVRSALEEAGIEILPGRGLDFHDPDGNRVQVVQYDEIQFEKSERVLSGMGLELGKGERALGELREKGLA